MTIEEITNRLREIEVQKLTTPVESPIEDHDHEELDLYRMLAREVIFGTCEAMEAFYDAAFGKSPAAIRLMLAGA